MLTRVNFYLLILIFILLFFSRYGFAEPQHHIVGTIEETFEWKPLIQGDDVILLIDSLGGDATAGLRVVNQIRELQDKGFKVKCFVKQYAMSAAFLILSNCSRRYARPDAQLMWHTVRYPFFVYSGFDLNLAKSIYEDLQDWQDKADALVRRNCFFKVGLVGFCPSERIFNKLRDKEIVMGVNLINIIDPCYIHGVTDPITRKVTVGGCYE